jgi:hypothetical protein
MCVYGHRTYAIEKSQKRGLSKEPTSETHCEQRILVLIETQSKSVYGRTCAIENNPKVKLIVNQEYPCRDRNESESRDKQTLSQHNMRKA